MVRGQSIEGRPQPAGPMTTVERRPRLWQRAITTALAHLELGKPRLSALVAVTTAAGFVLADPQGAGWLRFAWTLAGTSLAALGANALNQWWEMRRDARMRRTAGRPLPQGRVRPPTALAVGLAAGAGGPLLVTWTVGLGAGLLAAVAVVIYVFFYTPLKARTSLNTLVGAVVGAIPPLIGWQAAAGRLDPGAWVLAAILFVWQIPHFLALAWLYRDDYERGGFSMVPTVDPRGHLTACLVVVYALLLLPLTLLLTLLGVSGWIYAAGAILLGGGFVLVAAAHERRLSPASARQLFLASIIYLPLLLGLMMLDRGPR